MLYLIRHGRTANNAARLLQGRVDTPLDELGEQQAATAGEVFSRVGVHFAKIYSSPLKRAVRTAELAAPGVPVVTEERLLEMDPGPYEGMSLMDPAPEVEAFFSDFKHVPAPEGMESLEAGDYQTAYKLLTESGNEDKVTQSKYDRATALLEAEEYDEAYALLNDINETAVVNSSKYERAVEAINTKDYILAYTLLSDLKSYQDSRSKRESIRYDYEKLLLKDAQVGSTITFGAYEQDNNGSNGKEDLEWLVLAKENNRLLVITKYIIDDLPFDYTTTTVLNSKTWDICSLRTWLNDAFLKDAFNDDELTRIPTVRVDADKNPEYEETSPGNSTQDKVFLLSASEAEEFFASNSKRKSQCTAASGQKIGSWYLRTPGKYIEYATYVKEDGSINYYGGVRITENGIRPAMWITLSY